MKSHNEEGLVTFRVQWLSLVQSVQQTMLLQAAPMTELIQAYVKSKQRYKIYLSMNDVTSMLYVSLVRQFEPLLFDVGPPLWSSGQSFWLQIERSRVRFPALPDFSE